MPRRGRTPVSGRTALHLPPRTAHRPGPSCPPRPQARGAFRTSAISAFAPGLMARDGGSTTTLS